MLLIALAKHVAEELVTADGVQLHQFRWPDSDPVTGPLSLDDMTDTDWLGIPEAGLYPAFVTDKTTS